MNLFYTNTDLYALTLTNIMSFNLKGKHACICLVYVASCISLEWKPFRNQFTRYFRALRALQRNPTSYKKRKKAELYSSPYGWEPVISPCPLSVRSLSPHPIPPSSPPLTTSLHLHAAGCMGAWAAGIHQHIWTV